MEAEAVLDIASNGNDSVAAQAIVAANLDFILSII